MQGSRPRLLPAFIKAPRRRFVHGNVSSLWRHALVELLPERMLAGNLLRGAPPDRNASRDPAGEEAAARLSVRIVPRRV